MSHIGEDAEKPLWKVSSKNKPRQQFHRYPTAVDETLAEMDRKDGRRSGMAASAKMTSTISVDDAKRTLFEYASPGGEEKASLSRFQSGQSGT